MFKGFILPIFITLLKPTSLKKFITLIALCWACISNAQNFTWTGNETFENNLADTIFISVSGLPNSINNSYGIAHICMDISHSYKGSFYVKLVAPDGNFAVLFNEVGGSHGDLSGTCIGMDGTHMENATPPYTGIFHPETINGDISDLNNGQDPNGTWLFIVQDQTNPDPGTIHSVSLGFLHNPPVHHFSITSNAEPTGPTECPSCVCPGGATDCDLLPDMTASAKEIQLNHQETPGFLYLSNATPNIGYGPMEIWGYDSCFCGTTNVPCNTICPDGEDIKQVIKQRIYKKVNGTPTLAHYDRIAGMMTYHANHGHLHVDNWSDYTLRTATSNPDATTWPIVGTGTKQSFCLINLGNCANNVGECADMNGNPITTLPNHNLGFHTGCQANQGIYVGNYDVYSISLNEPIPLINVCNGTYYIVSITDPHNDFLESDETNNWVAVPVTLTQQEPAPTITPGGPTTFCQGGSVTLTSNVATNYLWSTGETTQSITVTEDGSYTVSTNCGASVVASAPVNVTVSEIEFEAEASPASLNCGGGVVQLNSTINSTGTQVVPTTFTSNQIVSIPDNNATGVTSTINVSGINPSTLGANPIVNVKINITHTYDGDLDISLISPANNSVFLSSRRGGSGNNFTNTIFSMSAVNLISAGSAPFNGTYKPDGNLNSLTGNINGAWKLKVQDLAGIDVGTIDNWSITFDNVIPGTYSYAWTSTPSGFSSTLNNPIVNVSSSTTYHLLVTQDGTGCTGDESIAVNVTPAVTYYQDMDNDNYGNTANSQELCAPSGNYTAVAGGDCNDNNANINPGAIEICNTIDDNCDLQIDEGCNTVTLNLKIFIEGYYTGGREMEPVLMNDILSNDPDICDTITVLLFEQNAPYNNVFTVNTLLKTNGESIVILPSAVYNSSYYIAVRHRNSIEIWSKNPHHFNSNTETIDFTTY